MSPTHCPHSSPGPLYYWGLVLPTGHCFHYPRDPQSSTLSLQQFLTPGLVTVLVSCVPIPLSPLLVTWTPNSRREQGVMARPVFTSVFLRGARFCQALSNKCPWNEHSLSVCRRNEQSLWNRLLVTGLPLPTIPACVYHGYKGSWSVGQEAAIPKAGVFRKKVWLLLRA